MKRVLTIWLVGLAAAVAHAQYARMDFSLQNAQGQAIAGASVQVQTQSACGSAAGSNATIYPASSGGTPLLNPLTTDGFGHAFGYLTPGCYTVTYSSPFIGNPITYPDQPAVNYQGVFCSLAGCTMSGAIAWTAGAPATLANLSGISSALTTTQTMSGGLNVVALNGIGKAETYTGTTAAEQIANCFAIYKVCDARGFGATTQVIDATIEVGTSGATQLLILSPFTVYQPTSASVPTAMFKIDKNGQVTGGNVTFSSSFVYTGKVVDVEDTIDGTINSFLLSNFSVNASAESSSGQTGGYCFYFAPPSGSYQQLVTSIKGLTCNGMQYGLYLKSTGSSGYWNGNQISNVVLSGSKYLWTFDADPTATSGSHGINGNIFTGMTLEADNNVGSVSTNTIVYPASGGEVAANITTWAVFDNSSSPVSNGTTHAFANTFTGHMDYPVNLTQDPQSGQLQGAYANVYDVIGGTAPLLNLKTLGNLNITANVPTSSFTGSRASWTAGYNQLGVDDADFFNNTCFSAGNGGFAFVNNTGNTGSSTYTTYQDQFTCEGDLNVNGNTAIPYNVGGHTGVNTGLVSLVPAAEAFGLSALTAGVSGTISTTAACSPGSSCIYKLTNCGINASTALGIYGVTNVSAGVSFKITAFTAGAVTTQTGDVSSICWQIN